MGPDLEKFCYSWQRDSVNVIEYGIESRHFYRKFVYCKDEYKSHGQFFQVLFSILQNFNPTLAKMLCYWAGFFIVDVQIL